MKSFNQICSLLISGIIMFSPSISRQKSSEETFPVILQDVILVAGNSNFDLIQYTLRAMEVVNSPLSMELRRKLSKNIVQVANERLETIEEKKYWIAILGRESKYFHSVKSSVGAVGLGQILPQFAGDFAKMCGIKNKNINDHMINLKLSACYFKNLTDTNNGLIQLALAGYNAGGHSQSIKSYKDLGSMGKETANYVSSVWLIASMAEQNINELAKGNQKTTGQKSISVSLVTPPLALAADKVE